MVRQPERAAGLRCSRWGSGRREARTQGARGLQLGEATCRYLPLPVVKRARASSRHRNQTGLSGSRSGSRSMSISPCEAWEIHKSSGSGSGRATRSGSATEKLRRSMQPLAACWVDKDRDRDSNRSGQVKSEQTTPDRDRIGIGSASHRIGQPVAMAMAVVVSTTASRLWGESTRAEQAVHKTHARGAQWSGVTVAAGDADARGDCAATGMHSA